MGKIGIVIPAYNVGKYLACTVEGVQAQTVQDWELVIVDDGSKDHTADVARECGANDARIRLVSQANGGVSAARNVGFRSLGPDCDYVIFLDGDDVWRPNALERLLTALESHPEAVGAHGLAQYMDTSGQPTKVGEYEGIHRGRQGVLNGHVVTWPADQPTTFANLCLWCCIGTPGVLLARRPIVQAAGEFDVQAAPAEDWDMFARLSLQGDIAFVDEVLLGYRQHPTNASANHSRMGKARAYVLNKLMRSEIYTPEQRRMARAGFRGMQRLHMADKLRMARAAVQERSLVGAAHQLKYMLGHAVKLASGRP
jgi:glycosyltransferase involved in cell wall biosynthesis